MLKHSQEENLNIKIGGCEAINDIIFCKSLRPKSIVAPMVESQYALRKFVETVNCEVITLIHNTQGRPVCSQRWCMRFFERRYIHYSS